MTFKNWFLSRSLIVCILVNAVRSLPVFPRFSMKHCPACNFTFPDFHFMCDFDGAELVSDRQCLALIKLPPRRSFIHRFTTSSKTLTTIAILGLFFTAAFIAYQQTTSRSIGTLLAVSPATPVLNTPESTRLISSPAVTTGARPSMRPRRASPVRFVVRSRQEKRTERTSRHTEVSRSAHSPSERQPKVMAMLKTTWRVLKRPFSF